MSKRIRMMLYGAPGVGKSTFAGSAPKPFFITTDGNYEWLDLPEKDHIQVNSWEEAKKAFKQNYDNYETIIVDLVEDLFKWCEQEFCIKNRIEHIGDLGFGKGYDLTRNDFFIEIAKLLNTDKHVILLSHEFTSVVKDRRGVEKTVHAPNNRIPEKVWDMIEGRLRYCLRCYTKAEETADGNLVKKRYISLVPKENEFGIIRGVNENEVPQDILLDFDGFAKVIGLQKEIAEEKSSKKVEPKVEVKLETKPETKVEENKVSTTINATVKVEEAPQKLEDIKTDIFGNKVDEDITSIFDDNESTPVKNEVKVEEKPQATTLSNDDKIAAIKAKMAALKAGK